MIKTRKMTASKVKTSDIFTDRNEAQKAFRKMYEELAENINEAQTDDDLGSQLFNIYGISGIGKTSVLERFRSIVEEEYGKEETKDNCLYYSFEVRREKEKESFLVYLASRILKNDPGVDLSKYLYAYRKSLLETDPDRLMYDDLKTLDRKKIGIGNEALKAGVAAAVDVVPMIAKSIPMANTVLELTGWLIDGVSERYFDGALEKKARSEVDGHMENELRDKLHVWFAEEAYTYFRSIKAPFVIFLDGFEKYEVRDSEQSGMEMRWLKDLIERLPNILWVIAGREKLNWEERFGLNESNQICLNDFSTGVVREYFDRYWEKYGEDDKKQKIREDLIDPIRKLTRGVPIYLRLCLDNFERYEDKENITIEAFGKDTTELLVRFFDNYSEDQKSAMLFLCSLPDGWTQDNAFTIYNMMKAKTGDLTGIRLDLGVLNSLLKTVAFEENDTGYRIHSVIRESVLKNAGDFLKVRLDAITCAMIEYADLCGEGKMYGRQILYYEEASRCWQIWGETHEGWEDKFIEYKGKLGSLYFDKFNEVINQDNKHNKQYYILKAVESVADIVRILEEKKGASAWDTLEKKCKLEYYLSYVISDDQGEGQSEKQRVKQDFADLCGDWGERIKEDHFNEPVRSIKFLYSLKDMISEIYDWDLVVDYIRELAKAEDACLNAEVGGILEEIDEDIRYNNEIDECIRSEDYLNDAAEEFLAYENFEKELDQDYSNICNEIDGTGEYTKEQVEALLNKLDKFRRFGDVPQEKDILLFLYNKLIGQFGGDNEITVKVLDRLAEIEELSYINNLEKAIEYRTKIYETYKSGSFGEYDPPLQYELLRLAEDEQESENVENAFKYYMELRDIYRPGILEISLEEISDRIDKLEQIR